MVEMGVRLTRFDLVVDSLWQNCGNQGWLEEVYLRSHSALGTYSSTGISWLSGGNSVSVLNGGGGEAETSGPSGGNGHLLQQLIGSPPSLLSTSSTVTCLGSMGGGSPTSSGMDGDLR